MSQQISGYVTKDEHYTHEAVTSGSFHDLVAGVLDCANVTAKELIVNNLNIIGTCVGCGSGSVPAGGMTWVNAPDDVTSDPTVQLNPLGTDYQVPCALIFPTDSVSSSGTRLTFDGSNGALRAGSVGGTEWDSVAINSVAFGLTNSVPTGCKQSAILAGQLHTITDFTNSCIVGGGVNSITGATNDSAFIGAGTTNRVLSDNGGIICGNKNTTSGTNSIICCGASNTIANSNSAVVCGSSTNLTGQDSAVLSSTGNSNLYQDQSSIIVGSANTIFNANSSIIAGSNNFVYQPNASILSGLSIFNSAIPDDSAIMGNCYHVGGTSQHCGSITGSVSVNTSDYIILVDSTNGDATLTLPQTVTAGQEFIVKKLVPDNNVTLDAGGFIDDNLIIPVDTSAPSRTYVMGSTKRASVRLVYSRESGGTLIWDVIMATTGTV